MKKLISILMLLMAFTMSSNAMSYEQARQQALFLTDKMAYELNLTNDQYEAAYEINLDYLMSVNTVDDLYGAYWRYRNLDMSYVLLDWQYRAFCDAAYFIVRCTSTPATGTSAYTPAIRTATTSTSTARLCTSAIAAATHGA